VGSPTVGGHCPSVSGVKGGFNLPLLYRIIADVVLSLKRGLCEHFYMNVEPKYWDVHVFMMLF